MQVEKILKSSNTEVRIYGKPKDWRDDFSNHSELVNLLTQEGISKLYLPNTTGFTGQLSEAYQFDHFHNIGDLKIYNHLSVEGLVIPNGSATFLCTADCPVIVYHDITNDILIAAHAGLGSIIDKQKILDDKPSRPNESVVDDIMRYTEETEDYEVFILCGINYGFFVYSIDNPIYGEGNRKILQYLIEKYGENTVPSGIKHGGISIRNIIRKQFLNHGIDLEKIHIDEINTFTDPNLWSHTEYVQKGGVDGRNGILIIHK